MKKFRVKFITEESIMQSAIVDGNTTQEELDVRKDDETQID